MALTEIPIELSSTPSIVDGGNATAITIASDESATFSGPINLTAGALAAAGNAGLSHRSADNKVYLQAGTGGFNILDDQQNTNFAIDSAGAISIGSGASISPDADADNLVIQENGAAGITIGSSTSSVGSIRFADSGSPRAGMIYYNHVGNEMRFYTTATERMRIDGSGNLLLNAASVTSPTGAAGPLFLMEGSNPEIIFSDDSGTANKMSMYYINDTLVWYGNSSENLRITNAGNLTVAGALSKGSGSFRIDHPLPDKTETHHLVHSFVESPQADNIYRGKVELVDGSATVNIDTAAGMTEGTYVLLNTNTQCFTSNESGWTAVKGSVSGNTLTITAKESCSDTISWMVVGERKDQHMIDTDWTDDNGKVIVEPLKENN